MDWMSFKGFVGALWVDKDALHIYAALIVQFSVAALARRSIADWLPWLAVLLAELLNEGFDIWFGEEPHIARWQVIGAWHDLLNTMALPTILLVLARNAPWLFAARARHDGQGLGEDEG